MSDFHYTGLCVGGPKDGQWITTEAPWFDAYETDLRRLPPLTMVPSNVNSVGSAEVTIHRYLFSQPIPEKDNYSSTFHGFFQLSPVGKQPELGDLLRDLAEGYRRPNLGEHRQ
jgi:hypothetical protein